MDGDKDDKSIFDKTVEAVKDIATIASVAAHKAMEPEPIKPGDEVVMMPMAATGLGDTVMPPFVVVPRKKKTSKKTPSKAATKKPAKKSVKKAARKVPPKKAKKTQSKSAAKKKTRKIVKKKKAKKTRR